jgi:hypothetical protein
MSSDTFLWRLMVPEAANGEGVRYMDWARILGYVTGTVDQELLERNEYLVTENRILKAQLKGRLKLSDTERATLGEIGHRLGRKVLGEVANVARPTPSWPGTASWWRASSTVRRPVEALDGLRSAERSSY